MNCVNEPVDESPPLQPVLDVLEDADCRAILRNTGHPRTATELVETCDISNSTVYRKLALLDESSLVRTVTTIGGNGGRTTRYERDFDELSISVDTDGEFSVVVERLYKRSDHRLDGLLSASTDTL